MKPYVAAPVLSVLCVMFLVNAGTAHANDLEAAYQAHQAARTALQEADKTLSDASDKLKDIDQLLAQSVKELDAQDAAYARAVAAHAEKSLQLRKLYEERLRAQAFPDVLAAEIAEMRRIWNILAEKRQYVDDTFFNNLDTELRAKIKQLGDMRLANKQRIDTEIDPAIERVTRERQTTWAEIVRLSQVSFDSNVTTTWFRAAADFNAAQKARQEKADALSSAEATYIEALRDASPSFLQRVTVRTGGTLLYDFYWKRAGYDDDVKASADYAQMRDKLKKEKESYERVLNTVKLERADGNIFRFDLANRMTPITKRLNEHASDYADSLWYKEVSLVAVEVGIVIAEAALTGGMATAARKGEQLASEAVTGLASREAAELAETAARGAKPLEAFVEGIARDGLADMVAKRNAQRLGYIASETEKEMLVRLQRTYGKSYASLAEATQEVPAVSMSALRKDVSGFVEKRANDLFPPVDTTNFTKIPDTRSGLQRAKDRLNTMQFTPGTPAGKAPGIYGAYFGRGERGLVPPATQSSAADYYKSGAVSWAVGTGVNGIREYAQKEAAATLGGKLTSLGTSTLNKGAGIGAVFSIVEASSKTVVSAYFDGKIDEAQANFWGAYAHLSAIYALYAASLEEDQQLWEIETEARRDLARIQALLAEVGLPREAAGEQMTPQTVPAAAETIQISLNFAAHLTAPPVVKLGTAQIGMTGQGRTWTATIPLTPELRAMERQTLSVAAGPGNQPYDSLDTNPETIAWRPLDKEGWTGYEQGADTRHVIRFQKRNKAVLEVDVDGVKQHLEFR